MLRSLNGEVLSISDDNYVILDVNGIGFEILCSRAAVNICAENFNSQDKEIDKNFDKFDKLEEEEKKEIKNKTRLIIYMQISEAGAALFGFASERERRIFLKITSIKGIGGRSGMAVLSALSVEEILRAVSNADTASFERVPGIGKKTAERLCFELRGILSDAVINAPDNNNFNNNYAANADKFGMSNTINIVTDALLSLGFSQADIAAVLKLIRAAQGENFNNMNEETLLKLALRELNKNRR